MKNYIFWTILILATLAQAQSDSLQDFSEKKKILYSALRNTDEEKDPGRKAALYNQLGSLMTQEFRPDSAVYFYHEGSLLYKKIGKMYEYYVLQEKLGALYLSVYNYKHAITAYKEASSYFLESKYYRSYVLAMNKLGQAYSGNEEHEKARSSYIKALEVNNNLLKDPLLEVENKTMILLNDMATGNYTRANKFVLQNINQAKEHNFSDLLSLNLLYAGQLRSLNNDHENAVIYLESAEEALISAGNSNKLPELYKSLLQAYLILGNREKMLSTVEKYDKSLNDVKDTEILKSSQEFAARYDSEKKDVLIRQLESENAIKTLNEQSQRNTIYGLIFAFITIGLVLYLIYRNYKSQMHNSMIIKDQRHELNLQNLNQIEKDNQIKVMESMLLGQEAERNRIGKDLHDSLGAMLSTIKLQMSAGISHDMNGSYPALQKAKTMIDEACEEVRKISRDMMPITLSKYGLHTALEELVDKYSFDGKPTVIYQAFGINHSSRSDLDLFVFRIIQELINNAIKHADADEIIIQINYMGDKMIITVEDDGNGFEYDFVKSNGMGLKNIDFRVKYLRGVLSVESSPGNGTITVIELPLKKNHEYNEPKFTY